MEASHLSQANHDGPSICCARFEKPLLALGIGAFLLLVYLQWPLTWDDSGILLAFSRNLAKYGDLVPAQYSDRVEGYSSFLWMILNYCFFTLGCSAEQVLRIAKATTTSLAVVNILLFVAILRSELRDARHRLLAAALFAASMPTIVSAVDGMETALYCTLVMLAYVSYRKRQEHRAGYWAFLIASTLVILVRHEGPLFLLPFLIFEAYHLRWRIFARPHCYVWAAVFLAYHTWHYAYFGRLLTNPIVAKLNPIYRHPSDPVSLLWLYQKPLAELGFRYIGLIVPAFAGYMLSRRSPAAGAKSRGPSLAACFAMIMLLVYLLVADTAGAAHRLAYPALPLALLVVFRFLDRRSGGTRPRLYFASLLLCLILFAAETLGPYAWRLGMVGVELRHVEKAGKSVAKLQQLLDLDRLTYAGPDMGGVLLFHGDNKRVLDLALLCDPYLAKHGYSAVGDYLLKRERPHIIETHGVWAHHTGLFDNDQFYASYTPVVMKGGEYTEYALFLRNDQLDKLKATQKLKFIPLQYPEKLKYHATCYRYGGFYELAP
ncbi:MAG: hypothetical protein JSU70_17265 [Phycisphaerales bacterium]|nr:MAG: hypothetical protein JSU70_17265 [Phycisphaerales bacterium]